MQPFSLDNSIGFVLNQAANSLKKELNQAFRKAGFDVTAEQWSILNRLWEKDGVSLNELADRTFKDNASITRTVDLMEKKELVERREDPKDRRSRLVFLREPGRQLQVGLVPCAQEAIRRATRGMSNREVQLLLELGKQVVQNLE
jgi:DNA-binding MarR family transcriptional regulator